MATKKKTKANYLSILIIFAVFLVTFTFFKIRQLTNKPYIPIKNQADMSLNKSLISIGETKIYVEVARTDSEKSRGLSGRKELKESEGMLFLF